MFSSCPVQKRNSRELSVAGVAENGGERASENANASEKLSAAAALGMASANVIATGNATPSVMRSVGGSVSESAVEELELRAMALASAIWIATENARATAIENSRETAMPSVHGERASARASGRGEQTVANATVSERDVLLGMASERGAEESAGAALAEATATPTATMTAMLNAMLNATPRKTVTLRDRPAVRALELN